MRDMTIKLRQSISTQSLIEGVLLLIPTYLIFGNYICTALVLIINNTFNMNMSSDMMTVLLNVLFDFLLMMMAIMIFKKELRSQFLQLKRRKINDFLMDVVIGVGMIYILNILGNIITLLTTNTVGSSANQTSITSLLTVAPLLMVLCIVIFAPVLEELIFRLMLFTGSYNYLGRIPAYIISAGLFGFLHIYSSLFAGNLSEILQIFPYLFMGLGLCFVYEKSNNIYVPIMAHAIINLISVMMYL